MNEFEAAAARCMALARERVPTQLPLWAEDQRGAPAAILRSALFGVVKRGQRSVVENQVLAAWAGNEIRYTGFLLDQGDLDVWLQILHIARQYPLGKDVRFTVSGFLRAIGRKTDGGSGKEWLRRSIGRLQVCGVSIRTANGREYQGPLVQDFFRDAESGRYIVHINPLLADLFDDAFVKLNLGKRQQLSTDLARWLQGYIQSHRATHDNPHRISVATLKHLSGTSSAPKKFREHLRRDMATLQNIGITNTWKITESDALEFVRPG